MENADLDGEIETITAEIQKIDSQFTASRLRIVEMACTQGYKKTREYLTECDWRQRAAFAKHKLQTRLRDLKGQRKEENKTRAEDENTVKMRRMRGAARMAIAAYDAQKFGDLAEAMEILRDTMGENKCSKM